MVVEQWVWNQTDGVSLRSATYHETLDMLHVLSVP